DVREKQETDAGMLPGAKHVPRGFLELRIEETVPDRGADVVLYCAGGTRSLLAAKTLAEMGYTRVRSMAGGYSAWKDAGLPLEALNPDVAVDEHRTRLTRDNALELFGKYDLVVDGSDNFGTRYLVNDACVLLEKPNVHGSIFRFDGQATTFVPGGGRPCYRCLFPEPPPPELAPSCQEAGVLGVLPGIIGLIQSVEAMKLLLGRGEPLVGRLLLVDAAELKF